MENKTESEVSCDDQSNHHGCSNVANLVSWQKMLTSMPQSLLIWVRDSTGMNSPAPNLLEEWCRTDEFRLLIEHLSLHSKENVRL